MSRGVFQVRVSFVNDVQKQEAWWERQHELAAENFGASIILRSASFVVLLVIVVLCIWVVVVVCTDRLREACDVISKALAGADRKI
ncbi:hypothetical protein CFP56_008392 [Quercus suber]|uniref:Uncharacterized protein n=1 Tax=Quercus suber TaxID=58331 RepID=A0AAW0I4Y3_QUESU